MLIHPCVTSCGNQGPAVWPASMMVAIEYTARLENVITPVFNLLLEPIVKITTVAYARYGKGIHDDIVQNLASSLKSYTEDCYKNGYGRIKAG